MKYKLLENETLHEVHCRALRTLYRIIAMEDFSDVHKGDKGGFVENYDSLSQSDNSWVYDNAELSGVDSSRADLPAVRVRDNARVYGNAKIEGEACVYGNAEVS